MDLKERLEIFKTKGYTCDCITGEIFNSRRKISDYIGNKGYIKCDTTFKGKKINILGHQFIYFMYFNKIPKIIDHINGIRNDNRISNLREVTHQENLFNTKNTKGFTWVKSVKKFKSRICVNGKNIDLGLFDSEVDAHEAYLQAKKIHHKI